MECEKFISLVAACVQSITAPTISGSIPARSLATHLMTTTKSMSSTQNNNLFIIESHSIKHIAKMLGTLRSIWQSSIGRTLGSIRLIDTTKSHGHFGSTCLFHCSSTRQSPNITDGNVWVTLFHRNEQVSSDTQTSVGVVVGFKFITHGGAVGSTGSIIFIKRSSRMPIKVSVR